MRVFELLGFGDLPFFIPVFPLFDHSVSHCSIKWLWNDLVKQGIIKACIIHVETERGR